MNDNRTSLRRMLEQLPTEQLDNMLHAELRAEAPDGDAVRRILAVLKEREKDVPVVLTPEMEEAWQDYCRSREEDMPKCSCRPLLKAAAVMLVLGALLFALPLEAEAGSVFDLLRQWSGEMVEFFNSEASYNTRQYKFQTDHPGLQTLYDTVTEAGAEGPAVPMWIPKTWILVDCQVRNLRSKKCVAASFSDGQSQLVYQVDIYAEPVARKYYKGETDSAIYEENGVTHTIVKNKDLWVVFWSRDNIECSLTMDCHEDILYEILGSIYNAVEAD